MESMTLEKNLLAKALVLSELKIGPTLGEQLVARLEQRCASIATKHADFDFVDWARTPIWGLLDAFSGAGFISHSGPKYMDDHEWCVAHLSITERGEAFLEVALREAAPLSALLSLEVAPVAAAG
jgi:hypothetical protein